MHLCTPPKNPAYKIASIRLHPFCPNRVYQYADGVASAIGCNHGLCRNGQDYYPAKDDCFCRSDLQTVAQNYLSTCVLSHCTVGDSSIDMSSAVSIYNSYCSAKGFVPATTTAPGTQGNPTATRATTANPGTIATATTSAATNNNDSGSSSFGGLSPGLEAGIAIAGLFVAILTLWVGWLTYKKMTS
jgi:hypothetical protein